MPGFMGGNIFPGMGNELSDQDLPEMVSTEANMKQAQAIERRRLAEKQIRALRNNYRPAGGFLNARGLDMTPGLGSAPGLSSKLGNT